MIRTKRYPRAYMYLDYIDDSEKNNYVAHLDIDCKNVFGKVKGKTKLVHEGETLYDLSHKVSEYKTYIVEEIGEDYVKFTNGCKIKLCETIER